ncbi:MAG TPA: hypothetical protein VJA21_03500 [Verrucomicrobiae bacterium]
MRKNKGLNGDLDRLPLAGSAGVLACEFEHRPGAWFCKRVRALAYDYGQR